MIAIFAWLFNFATSQKRHFIADFFGENILKNRSLGPGKKFIFLYFKRQPITSTGIDLTTHNSANWDVTTRPGQIEKKFFGRNA
jgi:hypothetical protein